MCIEFVNYTKEGGAVDSLQGREALERSGQTKSWTLSNSINSQFNKSK